MPGVIGTAYGGTSAGVCADLDADGALDVFVSGPSRKGRNYHDLLLSSGHWHGLFVDAATECGLLDFGPEAAR